MEGELDFIVVQMKSFKVVDVFSTENFPGKTFFMGGNVYEPEGSVLVPKKDAFRRISLGRGGVREVPIQVLLLGCFCDSW